MSRVRIARVFAFAVVAAAPAPAAPATAASAAALAAGSVAVASAAAALPPGRRRELSPAGLVTQATLPNGLQIVVLRDRVAPVVSTWLNVRAGSDDEAYTGLAHAQEHMFYRGSATLGGAQADEIAGFTGDEDNADTQATITQFIHTVPAQDLDLALHLDASRFSGLLDSAKDWSQERGAIEQEVTRDDSDATFRLLVKMQHHLMAGTPYADEGLGTLASFDRQIGAPQLRAFYRAWYHPNDAVYVIAGDVDPVAAVASVRRYFGGFPAVPLPKRAAARLAPLAPASYSDTSDAGSTTVIVGYRYPGLMDRDYAASVVLTDALNNQRGPLYGLVASGALLDVETDPTEFPHAGFATITAHVPVSTPPARAIAAIEAVVDRYRATGIPDDLVAAARRREFATYATAGSSIRGLGETWSDTLPAEHRTPLQDLETIRSVTPADVDRVLRSRLANRTATVAWAVPKNGTTAGDAGGAATGEESKPEPTVIAPLPAWAERALAALKPPAEPVPPARFTLANGLRVLVRTDRSSASVFVAGAIAHDPGLEEPAHQTGVGGVVEALMPYGTTTASRLQYQARLDAISATVKTGFTFSLSSLASTFDRGVELLANDELHPAFRQQDFAIVRDQRASAVAGEAASPGHRAEVARANALYPAGDPARRFPSAAEIAGLRLEDVRAYYASAFRPDLTTIAVVGDVTPEAARAALERAFGGWKASGPAPNVVVRPVPDNPAASTAIPANGVVQDSVELVQTLAFGNTDPAVPPLEVATTMLSGDFSSILIRDMRVTTGYVYSVGAALHAARARATFAVAYGCAPENYAKAQRVLERDLRRLQTTAVDADRLQRAKSHLLSGFELAGESYEGLATSLAEGAAQGLSPSALYDRTRQEFAVTAEDVRAAAAKWLRPAGFVRTIEGPART